MKIGLFGYGKMGKMIENTALNKGHKIEAIIDPKHNKNKIEDVDILIDFSHPGAVMQNVSLSAEIGKSLVVGTTGWLNSLEDIKTIVDKAQIGFIHSPNFSLGVQKFMKLIEKAAKLFPDFDVAGLDMHHNQKLDSPSGTALKLTDILRQNNPHLNKDFSFSSVRCGSIPGTHTIMFDSPIETITITHQARNREGFALGAVEAAEWLWGKKGFFTIDDLLDDLI